MFRNQGRPAPTPTKMASKRARSSSSVSVRADHVVEMELHAHLLEAVDLLEQDRLGQAELGDAVEEHAARLVQGLEDVHLVAALR